MIYYDCKYKLAIFKFPIMRRSTDFDWRKRKQPIKWTLIQKNLLQKQTSMVYHVHTFNYKKGTFWKILFTSYFFYLLSFRNFLNISFLSFVCYYPFTDFYFLISRPYLEMNFKSLKQKSNMYCHDCNSLLCIIFLLLSQTAVNTQYQIGQDGNKYSELNVTVEAT